METRSKTVDIRTAALAADPFALPADSAPQRRVGRPRGSTRAARRDHLGISLLPSETVRLRAAAAHAGYADTSAWARGLLLAASYNDSTPALDKDALAELARLRRDLNSGVGSNLNQAMLAANMVAKSGGVPDTAGLADQVRAAELAVQELHRGLQALLGPRGRP